MTVTLTALPRRLAIFVALAGLLATLVGAPSASAAGGSTALLRDCQDGSISGKYSQADYAKALRDIPTDVDEYTDCRSVIRRAQLGAAGGSGSSSGGSGGGGSAAGLGGVSGGGGSGGSGTAGGVASGGGDAAASSATSTSQVLRSASAQERAGVEAARAGAAASPVEVGGRQIRPQQLVADMGLAQASMPTTVVLSLIALGLAALAALVLWTKGRVDARRAARA